jgi:plastocyanin
MVQRKTAWGFGIAAMLTAVACGGGSSSPAAPTPPPPAGGGGGGTQTTTITITSSGVSPKSITVSRGTQVTFVNNDSTPHDMESNPHPEHTDCPEINQVGFINPGQSRQTGNLNTVRTCGYHDHNQPSNTALQGNIVIQ